MRSLIRGMSYFLRLSLLTMTVASFGCAANYGNVAIDASVEYQTIDGWGIIHYIEWKWEGPNRYPIPEQDVMNQLKNDLGIDYVQIYDHTFNPFMEETNDDNDPNNFNWNSYNSQFANHAVTFQRLKEMQNAGLKFALAPFAQPNWICPGNVFDSSYPRIYEEIGEYWAALCIYAKNNYNIAFPYIIIQTEPDYLRCQWTATELRDAIKAIGNRLKQEGFNSTMIIAPDSATSVKARKWSHILLADPVTKSYMQSIAYHTYDGTSGRWGPDVVIPAITNLGSDNTIKNDSLSLWMTEWAFSHAYGGRARDHIDELRFALDYVKMIYNNHFFANSSLYVIWDSEYDWGSDLDGNGRIERGGIFGPGFIDGKLNLKKYGHAISQYTKYIRPGSKRIEAIVSGAPNVFVTAYKNLDTGTFTIVFINKHTSAVGLTVNVNNIPRLVTLKPIRTSAAENSIELDTLTLTGNTFSTTLMDSSVTTFTGHFVPPESLDSTRVSMNLHYPAR